MADDGAGSRRRLERLVSYQGRARVREVLGVDDATLTSLLDRSLDWPADAREKFDRAWGLMELLGAPAEESNWEDEAGAAESGAPEPEADDEVAEAPEAEDVDHCSGGYGNPAAAEVRAVVVPKPPAPTGAREVHRRQPEGDAASSEGLRRLQRLELLWRARHRVLARYLWQTRGVPLHQWLLAWAVLLRLEIELIRGFETPLPKLREGGKGWERWDEDRRRRGISLRVQRLGDVRRARAGLHLRRLCDWLMGRDEDREEVLLKWAVAEAGRSPPLLLISVLSVKPDWEELDRRVPPGPRGAGG